MKANIPKGFVEAQTKSVDNLFTETHYANIAAKGLQHT